MSADLKPCPWCGGPAKEPIMYNGTPETGCGGGVHDCPGTDVLVPLAAWNTRAEGPAPVSAPLDREGVARIIDRDAFELAANQVSNKALRCDVALAKADAILALTAPQEPQDAVGAAEQDVGRYVYTRIEVLMAADPTPGTKEDAELDYLATVVAAVEEYGSEHCAGEDLSVFREPQEGVSAPLVLEKGNMDSRESAAAIRGPYPVLPETPCDLEDIGPPTPLGALRFRMEQGGHTQNDLAKLIGNRARASEILSGKRALSKAQIATLADAWGIPARSLLGPTPPAPHSDEAGS